VDLSAPATTSLADHWPLFGLRIDTPRLSLRLPSGDELAALAQLAKTGIHPPEEMPFSVPWTDQPPEARARSLILRHLHLLGTWRVQPWRLQLCASVDGTVVGMQTMSAHDFAVLREVTTGSWLGLGHQGRGLGTEMRAAVLELAFAGLGAHYALSSALQHNQASLAISKRLGYQPDGIEHHLVRGERAVGLRQRLDVDGWRRHRTVPVTIHGLEPCKELFGIEGK
jgi:RimJ/RimL family protein N-acetyltransferase